jgi:hypothetical protein
VVARFLPARPVTVDPDLAGLRTPGMTTTTLQTRHALPTARRSASRPATAWLPVLALASVVAAVVHAMVIREHFGESALYGSFFLGTTVGGLGYAAVVLLRPIKRVLLVGLVANASIVALWLFTRLVEVPVGPGMGEREAFGVLDVIASGAEVLCVVAAVSLLRAPGSQQVPPQPPQG